ncbi:MAG TPA: hypothetical protein VIT92_16420, partial [Burkholderiaceae bacterium]
MTEDKIGTSGDDYLVATPGYDGTDFQGLAGNDTLVGADGNDWFYGGSGYNAMYGNGGDDHFVFLTGENPNDSLIRGGSGHDYLMFTQHTGTRVSLNLTPAMSIEQIWGSPLNDVFNAGDLTQRIIVNAGAGNDAVTGGSAGDVLSGADGDDYLSG